MRLPQSCLLYTSVKQTFKISKVGTIAGCLVTEGKVHAKDKARVDVYKRQHPSMSDSSRHEVTASAQGEDATLHLGERRR